MRRMRIQSQTMDRVADVWLIGLFASSLGLGLVTGGLLAVTIGGLGLAVVIPIAVVSTMRQRAE